MSDAAQQWKVQCPACKKEVMMHRNESGTLVVDHNDEGCANKYGISHGVLIERTDIDEIDKQDRAK